MTPAAELLRALGSGEIPGRHEPGKAYPAPPTQIELEVLWRQSMARKLDLLCRPTLSELFIHGKLD